MNPLFAVAAGHALSAKGQHEANKTNIQLAREQMVFQSNMAQSAHQRQVADLKKAGLNPILSAGGSGAPSPGGATAQVKNVAEGVTSSALQARAIKKDIKESDSRVALQHTQEKVAEATKDTQRASAKKLKTEESILKLQKPAVEAENASRVEKAKVDAETYKYQKYIDMLSGVVGGIFGGTAKGLQAAGQAKNILKPKKIIKKTKTESYGSKGEHKGTTYKTNY
ncbi:DNA pilot protein [Microviridae sp.]|nr:DNA pilot protein [Microviridae sp.]